jgi:hypothetical protein
MWYTSQEKPSMVSVPFFVTFPCSAIFASRFSEPSRVTWVFCISMYIFIPGRRTYITGPPEGMMVDCTPIGVSRSCLREFPFTNTFPLMSPPAALEEMTMSAVNSAANEVPGRRKTRRRAHHNVLFDPKCMIFNSCSL